MGMARNSKTVKLAVCYCLYTYAYATGEESMQFIWHHTRTHAGLVKVVMK